MNQQHRASQLKIKIAHLENEYSDLAHQQSQLLRNGRDVSRIRQLMMETWDKLKPVRAELRRVEWNDKNIAQ